MPPDLDRLRIKQGEEPTDRHLRQLDGAIAAGRKYSGVGVRRHEFPFGTILNYGSSGGVGGTSSIFAPSVRRSGKDFLLSWAKGTIAGVEPKIDGRPISAKPVPRFRVSPDNFNSLGECNVYFRCTIAEGAWAIEKIEPFAAPAPPPLVAWQADCLALVLYSDGAVWRKLYSNQGWLAISRRSSGAAFHLFWGKM